MISPDKKANLFLKGAIASALLLGSMSGCEDAARPSADATKPATPATTPKTVPDTQNPPSTQVAGIPPLIASPQTVDFGIVEPGSELSGFLLERQRARIHQRDTVGRRHPRSG